MNCPKCQTPITQPSDPDSIVTCPGCGARLMTRAAALRSQGGRARPSGELPDPDLTPPVTRAPESPLGPESPLKMDLDAGMPSGDEAPPPTLEEPEPVPPEAPTPTADPQVASPAPAEPEDAPPTVPSALHAVLQELQNLGAGQAQILELLKGGKPRPAPSLQLDETPVLQPVRSRRRKSVLLVDDDPKTREAALAELQQADVPVRTVEEGHAAVAAIAAEKPDVIALELGLAGDMGAKDLINMIKATMAWVDIPIILWTREGVSSQKEARQIHGADEVVTKASGPKALVSRVITVFRGT